MDSTSPKEAVTIAQRRGRGRSNHRAGTWSSTSKRHTAYTSWASHKSHAKRKNKSKRATKSRAKASTRSLTRSQAIWAARAAKRTGPKTRRTSQRGFRSITQTETRDQVVVARLTDASTATSTDTSTDSSPCSDQTDLLSVPVNNPLDVNSPVLFPAALDGVLPRTDLTGAHNCGGHLHILDIDDWHSSPCRDCSKYDISVGELHMLPCGHYLCLRCLNKKAASVAQSIYDAGVWAKVQQALRDAAFAEAFYDYDYDGRPMYGQQQGPGPKNRWYDPPMAALEAVGMLCCGMDARLDHFLGCMDPAVSTAYWIAYAAVRVQQPEDLRSRCGWADCRRQLVPASHFVRRDQLAYAFCLSCGGTSLIKDRDGSTIPARAWQEDEESM
ncbi:hypothetical protein SPBR_08536 [Sporothrix brasiliensis 5110]|uniref:RING-type domain-containing protein n=1 Tax=Sporothrix brasiliensis 5110 TaxID=1398154 RepID=A0A0C2IB89_9PEZI|nr:uncharacterized protein SPBR_08536 [Sporothrix brasiliensis 5110]KIH86511.1 hypothetical protein SPBR_08536 [Sporothrix brasiliensis 5110]